MKSVVQLATIRELHERIARLEPRTPARWGRMTAPAMVCHLIQSARMAIGELPVRPTFLPFRFTPLKQLIVYWIPIPKGAPTAPELIDREPDDWHADVATLQTMLDRVHARANEPAWPEHPAFGRLTPRQWGVLVYRHSDHHLRQFGV